MVAEAAAALFVPELAPTRFELSDVEGLSSHLDQHGYVCIHQVVLPEQLARARDLLWQHLEGKAAVQYEGLRWDRSERTTWHDFGSYRDGLMVSTAHSDCAWYIRTLPRVLTAFAAAYGDSELVPAFDMMSINRPLTCDAASVRKRAESGFPHGKLNAQELHTHWNQDGYGDEPIYYCIIPLFDMCKCTGATALVPGSHRKVEEINRFRKAHGDNLHGEPAEFQACGLTPGVLNAKAGDAILFHTATYHAGCDAEDPTGESGHGPDHLLRAICIMSMTPTRLLAPHPHIFKARRRAYELDVYTGGSCFNAARARSFLELLEEGKISIWPNRDATTGSNGEGRNDFDTAAPNVRDFASAPPAVRRLVDPTWALSPSL